MKGHLDVSALKDLVVQSLDDDKALDIEVINLADQSGLSESALADFIVVASGTSSTQTIRMAEKLKDRLNARGVKNVRIEGASQGDWVVLDMGDIVVHLFRPEVREFYNIEKMWNMPIIGVNQEGFRRA
ncbi:MAG TPA: ribosome silencing factor [Alphaproteobacteria bacterium]|nr:ribosome silencing factor [Alphaproteobacteria bacterium]